MSRVLGPINDLKAETQAVLEHAGIAWQVGAHMMTGNDGDALSVTLLNSPQVLPWQGQLGARL